MDEKWLWRNVFVVKVEVCALVSAVGFVQAIDLDCWSVLIGVDGVVDAVRVKVVRSFSCLIKSIFDIWGVE